MSVDLFNGAGTVGLLRSIDLRHNGVRRTVCVPIMDIPLKDTPPERDFTLHNVSLPLPAFWIYMVDKRSGDNKKDCCVIANDLENCNTENIFLSTASEYTDVIWQCDAIMDSAQTLRRFPVGLCVRTQVNGKRTLALTKQNIASFTGTSQKQFFQTVKVSNNDMEQFKEAQEFTKNLINISAAKNKKAPLKRKNSNQVDEKTKEIIKKFHSDVPVRNANQMQTTTSKQGRGILLTVTVKELLPDQAHNASQQEEKEKLSHNIYQQPKSPNPDPSGVEKQQATVPAANANANVATFPQVQTSASSCNQLQDPIPVPIFTMLPQCNSCVMPQASTNQVQEVSHNPSIQQLCNHVQGLGGYPQPGPISVMAVKQVNVNSTQSTPVPLMAVRPESVSSTQLMAVPLMSVQPTYVSCSQPIQATQSLGTRGSSHLIKGPLVTGRPTTFSSILSTQQVPLIPVQPACVSNPRTMQFSFLEPSQPVHVPINTIYQPVGFGSPSRRINMLTKEAPVPAGVNSLWNHQRESPRQCPLHQAPMNVDVQPRTSNVPFVSPTSSTLKHPHAGRSHCDNSSPFQQHVPKNGQQDVLQDSSTSEIKHTSWNQTPLNTLVAQCASNNNSPNPSLTVSEIFCTSIRGGRISKSHPMQKSNEVVVSVQHRSAKDDKNGMKHATCNESTTQHQRSSMGLSSVQQTSYL